MDKADSHADLAVIESIKPIRYDGFNFVDVNFFIAHTSRISSRTVRWSVSSTASTMLVGAVSRGPATSGPARFAATLIDRAAHRQWSPAAGAGWVRVPAVNGVLQLRPLAVSSWHLVRAASVVSSVSLSVLAAGVDDFLHEYRFVVQRITSSSALLFLLTTATFTDELLRWSCGVIASCCC